MKAGVTYRFENKVVRYEFALRQVGIEPVRIFPGVAVDLDSLDGLVLTGGTDINPCRYGRERDSHTEDPDDERDEMELQVLKQALAANMPVLAICRGMQLFNVAHGGTLIQHLDAADLHSQSLPVAKPGCHDAVHAADVAPGTQLAAVVGVGKLQINSRHHQAVDRVGEGLVISAISTDGVIEAVERPGAHFAVAVQWHPEDRILVSEADRKLFEAFARAMSTDRSNVLQDR
jgi:putative glutamine amidotransferase